MRLFLDIGCCDDAAKRGSADGKLLALMPEIAEAAGRAALFGCLEGVADRPDRTGAAETAAAVIEDTYGAAIETSPGTAALREALRAANRAVRTAGERGRAAAMAALMLHGRRWLAAHTGNVRIWLCRDMQLRQLTRDHVQPRARRRPEVTRALGLSEVLEVEVHEGIAREGDVFVLTGSGVHDALAGATMLSVLQSDTTAQQQAEALVEHALAAGAHPYAGACIVRVEMLPSAGTATEEDTGLAPVAYPDAGSEIDGFAIERIIIKSRRYRLYRAKDRESGETVALRFPDPRRTQGSIAFLRDEGLARRSESRFVLKPVPVRAGRRRALYSVLEYRESENLAQRIRRKQGLPVPEALKLGAQLLEVLDGLHRQGMLHTDIRADSLLYDRSGRDLCMMATAIERTAVGVESSAGLRSSTLSYWAPELFLGAAPSEASDIYAAGVVLYRMLTAKYPYRRIRSSGDWKAPRAYVPTRDRRADLPEAIDEILRRACAVDPKARFGSAAEFARALDALAPSQDPPHPAPASGAWGWWLAAALLGGLTLYLYLALR